MSSAGCRPLGEADRRYLARRRRLRDTARFMASRSNVAPRRIRAHSRAAKWLRDFDELAEAFTSGTMTTAHLDRLRLGLDNVRTRPAMRRNQQVFVDAARDCSFPGLRTSL